MQPDITSSQAKAIVFSDVKLLRVKLFGELTKCIIIASGSILLCNDGTAGSCNLLHGIFLVEGICTQRKPLRKEKQDRDFLFPTMRYWMECIWTYLDNMLASS